ncbi:DUF1616 domain-containing protein [Halobacteriaceae bacterium SHR40]|uniref:DUF1616 domain-containing protein n=1 Tax=Halovenus amylolytica TaxID=2500550 RepID=UPI000FE3DF42
MRDWIHTDLLAICLVAVLTPAMVLFAGFDGNALQAALGLLFVFIAPGYAVVSILIPSTHTQGLTRGGMNPTEVSFVERLLIAVGLSVAIVPSIGVVLHFSPWGIEPDIFLLVTGIITLLVSIGAIVRRAQLERSLQFELTGLSDPFGGMFTNARSDREVYLNVLFVSGMILAVAGIGTAVAMSGGGEQFTEFYVQSGDPVTGEQVASGYPTNMTVGEQSEFVVGITNQEHGTEEYTVVVELQRLRDGEVVEITRIDQFSATVAHGETVERPVTLEPETTGESLRLSYQLYRGQPPEGLSVEQAYRHTYLWVDVSADDGL